MPLVLEIMVVCLLVVSWLSSVVHYNSVLEHKHYDVVTSAAWNQFIMTGFVVYYIFFFVLEKIGIIT